MNYLSLFRLTNIALFTAILLGISFSTVYAQTETILIKSKGPAVYFLSNSGKRYVFPTQDVFRGWFPGQIKIQSMTEEELAAIPLGGNITHKPGSTLVKITTDPKVYAVSKYGVLHWITSESVASQLYGTDWNKKVVDVPDVFFVNYSVGSPIETMAQYSVAQELSIASAEENLKEAKTTVPMLVVSGHPQPGQVSITFFAPAGAVNQQTLIKDGKTLEDPTIALCDKATCSITIQVNVPGSITAFTPIAGTYVTSNTITVTP